MTTESTTYNERAAMTYALAAVAMWSTVATAFKIALSYLPPAQLLLWASLFSLAVLACAVTVRGNWQDLRLLTARQWRASALYGALNPALYYLLLFAAYDRLPAQEAQALNYTWALTLAFLAVPFLGHRLRAKDLLAGIICYGGVLVIATRGKLLEMEFADPTGVILALASTLIWAGYWILNSKDQREPVLGLTLNFAFSIPWLILVNLYLGEFSWPPWQGFVSAAYIGLFEMGLAFICWLQGMRLTRHTSRISNLIFLSPFISLLLISFILEEQIYSSTLWGLGMILSGLFIQQYRSS